MDKPPGKGSGEKIEPPEKRLEFAKLSAKGEFPNWRKKLDNRGWMKKILSSLMIIAGIA